MTWILVLRNSATGQEVIRRDTKLSRLIGDVRRLLVEPNGVRWNERADSYLLHHYHLFVDKRKLAELVSALLRQKVSRNAIIGRYNRLRRWEAQNETTE